MGSKNFMVFADPSQLTKNESTNNDDVGAVKHTWCMWLVLQWLGIGPHETKLVDQLIARLDHYC